ncbi:hypothetical protein CFAM422_009663 [Trichoderma lentiforme]|uniref:Uncharacterized protein n=1 Tax=Trichoderma lentiforme TaxID=1567552 RepID=A0A9P4X955_9HYPO|nr:hypothetical protein CFAM422_009663 [Trichoderma lentiforme]
MIWGTSSVNTDSLGSVGVVLPALLCTVKSYAGRARQSLRGGRGGGGRGGGAPRGGRGGFGGGRGSANGLRDVITREANAVI